MDPTPYDVLAVELSSFQLHYTDSMTRRVAPPCSTSPRTTSTGTTVPRAWPTTPPTRAASTRRPAGLRLQRGRPRDRAAGPRGRRRGGRPCRSASPSACPAVGMVGVVDDILVDRAFIAERQSSAAELCTVGDLASPAPHIVANALGRCGPGPRPRRLPGRRPRRAARLPARRPPDRDRGHGRRRHVGRRLQGHQPPRRAGRRCWPTTRWCGSPAAWPRAPASTTWSPTVRDRLRGVVLLGRDRDVIAAALARHAPDVPVIDARCR